MVLHCSIQTLSIEHISYNSKKLIWQFAIMEAIVNFIILSLVYFTSQYFKQNINKQELEQLIVKTLFVLFIFVLLFHIFIKICLLYWLKKRQFKYKKIVLPIYNILCSTLIIVCGTDLITNNHVFDGIAWLQYILPSGTLLMRQLIEPQLRPTILKINYSIFLLMALILLLIQFYFIYCSSLIVKYIIKNNNMSNNSLYTIFDLFNRINTKI